nr:MAG TPA: hypothetical protein [Caudoviricetes sp.]
MKLISVLCNICNYQRSYMRYKYLEKQAEN